MITLFIILMFICIGASISSVEQDNICHYNYNYDCAFRNSKLNKTSKDNIKLCTIEHIPKEVNFNTMFDEKNSSSRGVVSVDFKSPDTQCKYKVTLFVNPLIQTKEECEKYEFHKSNYSEIHTLEKTICPKYERDIEEREQQMVQIAPSSCKENVLNLWYEYIYTGCYALGFKVDENYIFLGNELIKTEYKKIEVTEPKLRCTYKTTLKENESSVEMVTITADISLLAGSSGIRLQVAPTSLLYKEEENACNKYIENPVVMILMGMNLENDTDTADHNCSLTTTLLSSGDAVKKIECNFIIENLPKSLGYCFLVRILDERCHKNTSWKPPLIDKVPCAWTQYCVKTEQKKQTDSEEVEKIDEIRILKIPRMYLVIFVVIILVVLASFSTIFIAYRVCVQCTKNTLNTKLNSDDFEDDGSAILELNGSKSLKEKLVKDFGIVILYVKESDEFMNFMSEFRSSLKKYTGCEVYDWWDSDITDLASVGSYEWFVKMIKKEYRIVWVDTLKARSLFISKSRYKSRYNNYKYLKNNLRNLEICDFRDRTFPEIVDHAKRSNGNIEQEYQRHFVIRLETFNDADKTEDPFADLSPHARYLIPCHFDKLCCHISVRELPFQDEIIIEKIRLGKYLLYEPDINL